MASAYCILAAAMSDDDEREVLRETMAALDLPRRGLAKFFAHNRAFCEAHGGRRVYGELLALLDECERIERESK
jgi:hypothetical protein